MKGARGAQEHSPGGWSGKTTLVKMKKKFMSQLKSLPEMQGLKTSMFFLKI